MASRVRGGRDALPPLSLGLSSVRFIVNRLEADFARASEHQIVKYDPNFEDHDSPFDPSNGFLSRFLLNLAYAFSRCVPSVSFGNFGLLAVATGFVAPRMLTYLVVYPFCRLVFGTLYPAYASYKAVRTKNLKEYVKWMMYWIVFALFTCTETFTDVFLSWFPFYYEVKIVIVLWLLSPATKGSSILYRKFVHPALCRREQEIDEYIAKAKDQGYHTVLNLGTKGVNYATTVIMQTAIKGGGGLVQQIKKSYSLSDLTECEPRDERAGEADDVLEPPVVRRTARAGYNTRRSASESSRSLYFPEVDVDVRSNRARVDEPDFSHIKSSEDISSGYSSAGDSAVSLARAGSINARRVKARTAVTSIKRPQAAEDSEVIIEELQDDDSFEYSNMPALLNMPSPLFLSHTDPPFIYQYIGDQVKIIQVIGTNLEKQNQSVDRFADSSSRSNAEKTDVEEKVELLKTKIDEAIPNIPFDKDVNNNKGVNETDYLIFEDATLEPSEFNIETSFKVDEDKIGHEHLKVQEIKHARDDSIKSNLNASPARDEVVNPNVVSDQNLPQNDVREIIETEESLNKTSEPDVQVTLTKEDRADTTSLDTSLNENASAESDDEASFCTPDNSPKTKRKLAKGKYGKGKAPPPPKIETNVKVEEQSDLVSLTSQESLSDILSTLPPYSINIDPSPTKNLVVNPIAEIKRRHKSKSPSKFTRSNHSAIGKLLQLPGKLAFWHKNDKTKSDRSVSSGDDSRRSSTVEKADDFQSCVDLDALINTDGVLSEVIEKSDDQISFKDASDFESEVITHDIMEKSDALQKLIEAKIESHPEYKYVVDEGVFQSMSKSTDV